MSEHSEIEEHEQHIHEDEETKEKHEKYFLRTDSRIRVKLQAMTQGLEGENQEELLWKRMMVRNSNGDIVPLVEGTQPIDFEQNDDCGVGDDLSDVTNPSEESNHHDVYVGVHQTQQGSSLDQTVDAAVSEFGVELITDAEVSSIANLNSLQFEYFTMLIIKKFSTHRKYPNGTCRKKLLLSFLQH